MKLKKSILTLIAGSMIGGLPISGSATTSALTVDESNTLTYMKEEEKLARDVYLNLYNRWQIRAFSNIAGAEQRHMDKVSSALTRYNLADPVIDDLAGAFTNSELATLYTNLVAKGQASEIAALQVGAYIEEIDILDLQEAIAETTHNDLKQIYSNLMRGSRNHLRAFVGQIESRGVIYEAQAMSQSDVDTIVNSQIERGGKKGKGQRRGQGQGRRG